MRMALEHIKRVTVGKEGFEELKPLLHDGSIMYWRPRAARRHQADPMRWDLAISVDLNGDVWFHDDPQFPMMRPVPVGLPPDPPLVETFDLSYPQLLRYWPEEQAALEPVKKTRSANVVPFAKQQRRRGKGRPPQPFWSVARTEALVWLDENGYPVPGDRGQSELEEHIAKFLAARSQHPAESVIRTYVSGWIDEYRANLPNAEK